MTAGTVAAGLLSSLIRGSFHPANGSWRAAATVCIVIFIAGFAIFFLWNLITAISAQPLYDILNEETPDSELLDKPLRGFVAMEYYYGILNRTFVVFISFQFLYGWRACGAVTNGNRTYYEPLLEMLRDPDIARDRTAIEKLAKLRGGFCYASSAIAGVAVDGRQKWGMGGIAHSGRINIRLISGRRREFILLGDQIPEEVRDCIVGTMRIGVTSGL